MSSTELAPASAAVPAALPAIPAPTVVAVAPPPAVRCENCGASVPGLYCGTCGQRLEPPIHSLWHFSRVATEDLTHADSRLWRTLVALLFRPGFLTRQFLDGRRASYLPPVRLYLVLSVVFFIWFSATQPRLSVIQIEEPHAGAVKMSVVPLDAARGTQAKPGESAQQRAERLCRDFIYQGPWQQRIAPRVTAVCKGVVADNGKSVREAFLRNVPHAMFLFLPLLAGAMMLFYWRPRRYYVEHLLFFVHNHAFVFLLLPLAAGLTALLPFAASWVQFATRLWIAWYLYRSMRVVYGQGRALTLVKAGGLAFFYLVSGALMLGLTTAYSALTLYRGD